MSADTQTAIESEVFDLENRIIGRVKGDREGPLIIAVAGIHGNEPTGILAIQHLLEKLEPIKQNLKGEFLGLVGNLPALKAKKRYVDEDMNRIWFTSILDKIRRTPAENLQTSERREIKELLKIIDPYILDENRKHPVIFADLHSFSAESGLFVISSRDEANIELLGQIKVPLIFGIEKALQGTALNYIQKTGNIGFAFEAGQHYSETAELNATAGLLCMMVSSGCIPASKVIDYPSYFDYLVDQTSPLPHKVEFQYKHIIEPEDEFVMNPGFKNFDRVKKGDWLANDRHGKIKAQLDGFVLMPLYQDQGEDGFFIVQECT